MEPTIIAIAREAAVFRMLSDLRAADEPLALAKTLLAFPDMATFVAGANTFLDGMNTTAIDVPHLVDLHISLQADGPTVEA